MAGGTLTRENVNEGVSYFNAFGRRDLGLDVFSVGETSGLDFPVARGPVPRDRWGVRTMARDRPSPYGKAWRFFHCIETGRSLLREGLARVKTGTAHRQEKGRNRDREVSPTGETASFKVSRNNFDNNEL